MNKKGILSLILTIVIIAGICSLILKYSASAKASVNIKVMKYTSQDTESIDRYQIEKYEGIKSVEWLGDDEVLILSKNDNVTETDSNAEVSYCSIYNLETGSKMDYKDANICEYLGTSQDKNYVLYAEARIIPKVESKEWQEAVDSGNILHKNVKILNLKTAQISQLDTEKINSDAQFKWISNDKIIENYFDKWKIVDINGNIYASGSYQTTSKDQTVWLSGVDDLKDSGDAVEGKFYYSQDCTQYKNGPIGIKINSYDISSNKIKTIYTSECSNSSEKKGKIITMDNYYNNGEASANGVFENRTFGSLIIDVEGNLIQEIKLPKGRISSNCVLSPDGSKAVYVEGDAPINCTTKEQGIIIKYIDIKTGEINEIIKTASLKEASLDSSNEKMNQTFLIKNICWNSTGTAVSFTYQSSLVDNNPINTYIINFDN